MENGRSYGVVESLLDSMKNFVVLGLCGRTGSGCTTAANILEQSFVDLHIPSPDDAPGGSIEETEKLILYKYAKENWARFYLIKVSRILTGYLLTEDSEAFMSYLKKQFGQVDCEKLEGAVTKFYEGKMRFRVPKYYTEKLNKDYDSDQYDRLLHGMGGFLSGGGNWNTLFPRNGESVQFNELGSHINKEPEFEFVIKDNDRIKYEYSYNEKEDACEFVFDLKDMQRLLDIYELNRKTIQISDDGIIHTLLYEYVFNTLPAYANELWDEIEKIQRGLSTVILQDIGINLRVSGKALICGQGEGKDVFKKDAFLTTARRINTCIKILRAALQTKKEFRESIKGKDKNEIDEKYESCKKYLDSGTNQVLVAIDSIKNPFESQYLKARYSSYYLIAMYTDERERRARLEIGPRKMTTYEIEAIDKIEQLEEYKKLSDKKTTQDDNRNNTILTVESLQPIKDKLTNLDLNKILPFVTPNVGQSIESADIFINNQNDNEQRLCLKWNLIRYVSLIMNPGLVLPTPIERCMQIAQTAKVNSGCISRQVGAVLTDSQYMIRSIGWNDTTPGRMPCTYRDMQDIFKHWSPDAYSDYENDDNDTFQKKIHAEEFSGWLDEAANCMHKLGKRLPFCFKDVYNAIDGNKNQVHPRALHAEERAFLDLADQGGTSIRGGYLFTTSSPCELCSKKVCYMGISKVYYVEPYSGISGKHVMSDGPRENRPVQELFTGALGRAYTHLYTPIIPKKDEIEMWLGGKLNGEVPLKLNEKSDENERDNGG